MNANRIRRLERLQATRHCSPNTNQLLTNCSFITRLLALSLAALARENYWIVSVWLSKSVKNVPNER